MTFILWFLMISVGQEFGKGWAGCGTLIAVRWWLELEQWQGWGWSSNQLGNLFIWSKGLFMWPLLMGSLCFLTTWQPQGNQAAHKAWSFLERSRPNGSYIAFYDPAPEATQLNFCFIVFYFCKRDTSLPRIKGKRIILHLLMGEWQDSIIAYGSRERFWWPSLENTTCHNH